MRAYIVSVGLPFFALASASPLLQKWFSTTRHPAAQDPYFLYAASNAGSMLALLGYPLLLEPLTGLSGQSWIWSTGYVAFGLLAVVCGRMALGESRSETDKPSHHQPGKLEPLQWRKRLLWVLTAFVPSSLMLGVTQHLTTDIAPFPLLWVIPLALYLLTFIIAFSQWGVGCVHLSNALLPVTVAAVVMLLMMELNEPILPQFAIHLLGLVVIGLVCHGRLAAERPDTSRLTEFYLWIAIGGVAGGAFNSLLAPVLFNWIAEYPIVLVLACLMRPDSSKEMVKKRSKKKEKQVPAEWRWHRVDDLLFPALLVLGFIATSEVLDRWHLEGEIGGINWEDLLQFGVPAVVCLAFAPRRLRFALGIMALLATHQSGFFESRELLYKERTFFGVYRVMREGTGIGNWHHLYNGTTKHGNQYDREPLASVPTTYFTKGGPVGDLMQALDSKGQTRRIAIVGLGTGTLAVYGRPKWRMTFFEIDPEVVRIATDPDLFTYVSDSLSPIEFVTGDARLRIASVNDGAYDLIAVDAFSSDAIPVHLITLEAVELFLNKLAPEGMLVFHITNRHLNLSPVLAGIAQELNLVAAEREDDERTPKERRREQKSYSDWAVLARQASHLGPIEEDVRWVWLEATPGMPVWTDDYSNILGVLY